MSYTTPSIGDFKTQFTRDFPYGVDQTKIMDTDIQSALDSAGAYINPALYSTQTVYTQQFLLLSAHYLVLNIRASSQGIAGNYPWMTASKGVGSVSESFAIPQKIQNNPLFAMLTKTYYGSQFLMFVLPQIVGNAVSVYGRTNP